MVKATRVSRGTPKKKGKKMQPSEGQSPDDAGSPRIEPHIQHEIGKHLRAHYDDIINETVPDRLMELLERLEHSVTRKR
jgi:hypothetical protein